MCSGPTSAAVLREVGGEFVGLIHENASGEDLVRCSNNPIWWRAWSRPQRASISEVRIGIEQLGWRVTDVVTSLNSKK